jgi:histidinol dehydrogenase
MRCERIRAGDNPARTVEQIRSLAPTAESVSGAVAEIVARVRRGGDEALREYIRELDTGGSEPKPSRVEAPELAAAADGLDPTVRSALELAIENVRAVAEATVDANAEAGRTVELGTHTIRVGKVPVRSAAVYVPGGRAPYPSTVVMGVVPAQVARVEEIVVCSPPGSDGELHPAVLAACHLVGASTVYRMGGAHAIAALAYGTETIAPVDVIVGPGNLYVQEAKHQVSSRVGIDGFAGPSDLMVIADPGAERTPATLDLLAQSEHGPGTLVVAVSVSGELLDGLEAALAVAPDTGAVGCLVEVADAQAALALAETFAPEHLQLVGTDAEALAERVTRAGCVFVGAASGTAFGDYVAGSNHILPTAGAARFASGLTPERFLRSTTEVRITDPGPLARVAAPLARAEGFELHARSMEARIRDNQRT